MTLKQTGSQVFQNIPAYDGQFILNEVQFIVMYHADLWHEWAVKIM